MLFQYFHRNESSSLVALIVISVMLAWPLYRGDHQLSPQETKSMVLGQSVSSHPIKALTYENTEPLFAWTEGIIYGIFGPTQWAHVILALLLVLFHIIYISHIVNQYRFFGPPTYFPALIFSLLIFFGFSKLYLSAEICGSAILLIAFNQMIRLIHVGSSTPIKYVNIGFYLGIASLFVYSYTLFLVPVVLILSIFSQLSLRGFLAIFLGFSFPHLSLLFIFFSAGELASFFKNYYLFNLSSVGYKGEASFPFLWLGGIPILFFSLSLLQYFQKRYFSNYTHQMIQVLLIWLAYILIDAFVIGYHAESRFVVSLFPVSLLITHLFFSLSHHYRQSTSFLTWVFVIGMIGSFYNFQFKHVKRSLSFSYSTSSIHVTGKRILVLEEDWVAYLNNIPCTRLINWSLCQDIFKKPEQYSHVLLVANELEDGLPELIVDKKNYLAPFFAHLPKLKSRYRREESTWVLIHN